MKTHLYSLIRTFWFKVFSVFLSSLILLTIHSCEKDELNQDFQPDVSLSALSKSTFSTKDFHSSNTSILPSGSKLFFLLGTTGNQGFPGTLCSLDFGTGRISKLIDIIGFDNNCGNFDVSRDGTKIVFAALINDDWDLWVANLDLKTNKALAPIRRLTNTTLVSDGREEDPKFSYDGQRLVYKKDGHIYILNLVNGNNTNMTETSTQEEWGPVFSPDYTGYIAFTRGLDPNGDIVTYNLETNVETVVTSSQSHDSYSTFNYNGDLLFSSNYLDGCNDDIYQINRQNLETVNAPNEKLISNCNNKSEADPSIVYGNNSYLTFVSDKDFDRYAIYLYSFVDHTYKRILYHNQNRLIAPIIYSPNQKVKDKDGNVYNTVIIGSQVWMKENLKTTKYNDGKKIPLTTNDASGIPGYSWYNNDVTNKNIYGALYNWSAVNTGKLCPTGWHIPTDEEWTTLKNFLGGVIFAGGKLKETGTRHWNSPNSGATNETGFSALPGGYREYYGGYFYLGTIGFWWSASAYDPQIAWTCLMYYNIRNADRGNSLKVYGLSVRCLKDQ